MSFTGIGRLWEEWIWKLSEELSFAQLKFEMLFYDMQIEILTLNQKDQRARMLLQGRAIMNLLAV